MSTKKRKLTEIETDTDTCRAEPDETFAPLKKQKFERLKHLFDVRDIRCIVLDYLPFQDESYELFMHFADDEYLSRRLLTLNKHDIQKIKRSMEEVQSATHCGYNLYQYCSFYSNIKLMFGERICHELMKYRIGAADHAEACLIDDNIKAVKLEVRERGKDYVSAEFEFKSPINISHMFDEQQQNIFQQLNIDMNHIVQLTLTHPNVIEEPQSFIWRVLPAAHRNVKARFPGAQLVLALKPSPELIYLPICTDLWPKRALNICTTPFVRIPHVAFWSTNDKKFHLNLTVDHDLDRSDLGVIYLRGDPRSNNDSSFDVSVNFLSKPSKKFAIYRYDCNVKFKELDSRMANVTDAGLNFIRACNGGQELMLQFDNDMVGFGQSTTVYSGETFWMSAPEQSFQFDSAWSLVGYTIERFPPQQHIEIRTSQIPSHWKYVTFNNKGRDENVKIIFDSFPERLQKIIIGPAGTHIEVDGLSYNDIPKAMESIFFPCGSCQKLIRIFPFLFDKKLTSKDLPYRKVEFVFTYGSWSRSVRDWKQFLNPLFTAVETSEKYGFLTIYRQKNEKTNCLCAQSV